MTEQKKLTKQEAIEELRREADELENKPGSITEYASNAYRARIRRNVADKLEAELQQIQQDEK